MKCFNFICTVSPRSSHILSPLRSGIDYASNFNELFPFASASSTYYSTIRIIITTCTLFVSLHLHVYRDFQKSFPYILHLLQKIWDITILQNFFQRSIEVNFQEMNFFSSCQPETLQERSTTKRKWQQRQFCGHDRDRSEQDIYMGSRRNHTSIPIAPGRTFRHVVQQGPQSAALHGLQDAAVDTLSGRQSFLLQ